MRTVYDGQDHYYDRNQLQDNIRDDSVCVLPKKYMELWCNYILLDLLKNHKDLCGDYLNDAAWVTTSIYMFFTSNLELTGEGLNINNININKLNNVIPRLYKKGDMEFNRKSLIRLLENLIRKETAIYNGQRNKVHKIIGDFINGVETMAESADGKKERS